MYESERSRDYPTSKNYRVLKECGPQPNRALPINAITDAGRKRGVWKFEPRGSGVVSNSAGGKVFAVYYLQGEEGHEPETVLRRWLEVNSHLTDIVTKKRMKGVLRSYGPPFNNVYGVLDDYDFDSSA